MVARAHFASFLPLAAVATAVMLLAAACDGGGSTSDTSNNGGNGGSGAGNTGDCSTACEGDTPVCDPESKTCVGCIPGESTCDSGKFCNPSSMACESGCDEDSDCTVPLTCNTATNTCVGCVENSQCAPGTVCNENGQCVAGCTASQPCTDGLACCNGTCADLQTDPKQCGACEAACPKVPGAAEVCEGGQCKMGACDMGANGNYADCNLNAEDGCEWDLDVFGPCTCTPGQTQDCYTGQAGTKGVGTCKGGTTECSADGANWGPCVGEITPKAEVCANAQDEDCNGTADDSKDLDGDGWKKCDGDCCDVALADGCGEPGLVNPGAFEVGGNMVDDDCDGQVDNILATCDGGLASDSSTATDYAKAIDLCATTTANPPKKDAKWGVISAKLSLADGNGTVALNSKSIRNGFGTGVTPLAGSRIAVLSTGNAADQTDTSPGFAAFQVGADAGTTSGMPSDWIANAGNGGLPPNAPGCPDPFGGTTANDAAMLTVTVRVPTNAKSFSVSSNFYSAEYPEWVCTAFNDYFVTLLDSSFVAGPGQVGNPQDKNLAFYQVGANKYPVGVNLASGDTGLFNQCLNGTVGCSGANQTTTTKCVGTNQLQGTGFQITGTGCGTSNLVGGGTGWLITNGNVTPGETITLRFAVWDTSDHIYDSLVLLDNFQWLLDASTPGTHE